MSSQLGRTSVVYFLSKILSSLLGFLATLYLARELGAAVLGVYSVIVGLAAWLSVLGRLGVPPAISKRVSEGTDRSAYVLGGATMVALLAGLVAVGVFLFRGQVNQYVGYPAALPLMAILWVVCLTEVVVSSLNGLHLVEVQGYLTPVHSGVRSSLQIAVIFAGGGVLGLLGGYVAGYLVTLALGGVVVYRHLEQVSLPDLSHARSLFEYARFSWIGDLRAQAFSWVDIIVLGFFVPSTLVGIYAAAWNISQFLILFSSSISTTVFPEMSEQSAREDTQTVVEVFDGAVSYAGLLLIPGLVGGALLGDRILRFYGPEFTRGALVLALLIAASLVQAYQSQVLTTLDALDRPDISFRVNGVFLVSNVVLNAVLVFLFGWVGAAVATGLSALLSLGWGLAGLRSVVDVPIPSGEIARQVLAAGLMGLVVEGLLIGEETWGLVGSNVIVVLTVVPAGAAVYFLCLLGLSRQFRVTVRDNVPFLEPYLTWE